MGEHCRTRVQEKLKVRLNISVFFTVLAQGGAGTRAVSMGVSEDPNQCCFTRVLSVR